MATLLPFPSSKARVRAMSSASWLKYLVAEALPLWSQNWRLLHIQLLFFHPRQSYLHQCTRFPQDWSEDLLTIPLGVLSNGPKFLSKSEEERALWGRQEGSWVKKLTRGYSQAWIFWGFFDQTWYLRILWSDIHKWPLPFRSYFTWWLVKIVCPQEKVVKHLLSGLQ